MLDIKDIKERIYSDKLVDYAEKLTNLYIENTTPEYRKSKGQFFTPKSISEFMVSQFFEIDKKDEIRILDAGAGIGIFISAICDLLISKRNRPKVIFDLYENDANIQPYLLENMKICKEVMQEKGFNLRYRVFKDNFITKNLNLIEKGPSKIKHVRNYDFVISNPPYYKIKKDSPYDKELKRILKRQPNIYILFMAISAKLLKNGGQLTVITPRSYCSGQYSSNFRKWFFDDLKPTRIHVFDSRKEVFKRQNVLQEMIILTGIKDQINPKYVLVSKTKGEIKKREEINKRKTKYTNCVIKNDNDIIIRIPTSKNDELLARKIDKQGFTLDALGMKISTGPVVPFRANAYLKNNSIDKENYVPLIWMQNIKNGKIFWPVEINNKPIAIRKSEKTKKMLVPNKNYVLIKRFSAKEGKRRIDAGVFLKKWINSEFIGIENHVNYIYKINGDLTEDEAYGLASIFNSKIYDRFFQIINGSTQVNATEIMNIPLPNIEKIKKIGRLSIKKGRMASERLIIRTLDY